MVKELTYSFMQNTLQSYGSSDIYRALEKNILPANFVPNDRYDELLLNDVFGFIFNDHLFQEWCHALVPKPGMECIRSERGVPTICTGYNLSVAEVRAAKGDARVIESFMKSMARCLVDRGLPYEEVFACILDGIYTIQHVTTTRLDFVH